MLRGRIHQDRDKRLAGPKNKNNKKDPRGHIFSPFLQVGVGMLVEMSMEMVVVGTVFMRVRMGMFPLAKGLTDSPNQVGKTETSNQPTCDGSTKGLQAGEPADRNPKNNSGQPEQDGTEDVPEPAETGDENGLPKSPFPCLRQDDKRKIVVWSEKGVQKTNRSGRYCKDRQFLTHGLRQTSAAIKPFYLNTKCRFQQDEIHLGEVASLDCIRGIG